MPKLAIKKLPLKDLVPYANNARLHTTEQIETIVASIKEFGFNDPVGIWTNTEGKTEIVEGHGRVLAAEKLGMKEVPTINLDHLTDEQRRAYSIVHNQTTDNSIFDYAIMDAEIGELEFDWESFGIEPLPDTFALLDAVGFDVETKEAEKYYLTLEFPKDKKEIIEKYVKDNDKSSLSAVVVSKCEEFYAD